MEVFEYYPPTDKEIEEAQEKLGVAFPDDYISFIKSGYDLGDTPMEALEINSRESHVDIFEVIVSAREYYGLPSNLLPISEDNSDYYCLNSIGEVVFWSPNGITNEKWPNVDVWRKQMIAERSE